jgi:hypothetical protein
MGTATAGSFHKLEVVLSNAPSTPNFFVEPFILTLTDWSKRPWEPCSVRLDPATGRSGRSVVRQVLHRTEPIRRHHKVCGTVWQSPGYLTTTSTATPLVVHRPRALTHR